MVEVDATLTEEGCDGGEVAIAAVDGVFAGVVLERFAGDDEFGVWDD